MWDARRRLIVLGGVAVVLGGVVVLRVWRPSESGLTEQLRTGSPAERLEAVHGLEQTGSAAASDALAGAIDGEDPRLAGAAVAALGRMGRARDVGRIKAAARDPREEVRVAAFGAMGALGEQADIPVLVQGLEDAAQGLKARAEAARSLGRLEAYDAMPALVKALEDRSPLVRGRAGAAVRKILEIDLGFHANDPPDKRRAAIDRIKRFYPTIAGKHADYMRRMREKSK